MPIKKKKSLTVAKAKKKAWEAFSLYVRTKGSDINGYNVCVTCGSKKPIKQLQAGHWIPGRHLSILFDERNCHPQCYRCNIGLKSNPISYYQWMLKNYGQEVMDELIELDKQPRQMKVFEFLQLEEKYKSLLTSI